MVHIHHLEVRLEVEGDDDERTFARLFDKYVRRWNRQAAEEKNHRRRIEGERRLDGGQHDREGDE